MNTLGEYYITYSLHAALSSAHRISSVFVFLRYPYNAVDSRPMLQKLC